MLSESTQKKVLKNRNRGEFWDSIFGRMISENENRVREAVYIMNGYYTKNGYYGLVDGRYMLFASETDYYEMMEDAA